MWSVPDGRHYEIKILENTPSVTKSATPEYVDDVISLFKQLRADFLEKEERGDPPPGNLPLHYRNSKI